MTLKNVTYANAGNLTKKQKRNLGIREDKEGMIAIENHEENGMLVRKCVFIENGIVDYIMNGDTQNKSEEVQKNG